MTTQRFFQMFLCLGLLATGIAGGQAAPVGPAPFDAASFWREQTEVPFDVTVLEQKVEDGIAWQSMVYTSEIYRGESMRIFAFYARPAAKGKYPAVLSIHGGGGSADLNRAKEFARAGYACLSYDWNTFNDPKTTWKAGDPLPSKPFTVYGTKRYDDWAGQFSELGPTGADSVLYRSIMASRRGLSWMSKQREVDAKRLVVEGHSWGGFTTQLLAGIEPRLKAAVASASAGAWISRYVAGQEGHTQKLSPWAMFEWSRRYDPASHADRITAPILIRLATDDFFGSIDTLADYWDTIRAPKALEMVPSAGHTFGDVETRVAWFNHWVKGALAFPTITDVTLTPGKNGAWTITAKADGPGAISKAAVSWTTGTGAWNTRPWVQRPLQADGNAWTATFTPTAAGGPLRVFVSVRDANGRVVSCMPLVRPLPAAAALPTTVTKTEVRIARTTRSPLDNPDAWAKSQTVAPVAPSAAVAKEKSMAVDTLWDEQALYLRVRVTDGSPWVAYADPAAWWNGDSLQMRLRTEEKAGESKLAATEMHVLHLGWYGHPTSGALAIDAVRGKDFSGKVTDVTPINSTVTRQADGYTLTAALPWAFIDPALKPAAGRTIRFALMANYGDLLTTERLDSVDLNGADSFNQPDNWGMATLTE